MGYVPPPPPGDTALTQMAAIQELERRYTRTLTMHLLVWLSAVLFAIFMLVAMLSQGGAQ
jgi:hypothetical protein